MSTASNIIKFEYIKVGTSTYSGNADPVNVAFRKINANFTEIANSLSNIIVPVASVANTGTVKIGHGINVAPDGTISVGQVVGIGAPANLTGSLTDQAGTIETDNNLLYVSTGTFSPTFAFNPNSSSTSSNLIVTTSSYLYTAAQSVAGNYNPDTWVLYDRNYTAYPILNVSVQQGTTPVTILSLHNPVNYTTSSTFYVATQDVWHRIPYLDNVTNALPVDVIPLGVGDIRYTLNTASMAFSNIGTTAGDLTVDPQGNFVALVNSIFTGSMVIGSTLTVSTINSVGDLHISNPSTTYIASMLEVTSSTMIQGVLSASELYRHDIGGVSIGPFPGAVTTANNTSTVLPGELISTNNSVNQDLYIIPAGNFYVGNTNRNVFTNFYGQTTVNGGFYVYGDQTNSGTINAKQFNILGNPSTATIIDTLTNNADGNLVLSAVNNFLVTASGYVGVSGQIQALDYTGPAQTPASFSQGITASGISVFDNKWVIAPSSIHVYPGNALTITGGSGAGDSVLIATNNSTGTVTLTASNSSAVFGNNVSLQNATNSFVQSDATYVSVLGKTWKFDRYGNITFPDNSIQLTAFTSNPALQSLAITGTAVIQTLSVNNTATITSLNVTGPTNLNSNLSVGGNALITGNLTVLGAQTIINSSSMSVEDPIIDIGTGPNGADLTTDDRLDKGLVFHYFDSANNRMFLGRDGATGRLILRNNIDSGTGVVSNSDYTNNGQWAGASFGSLFLKGGANATGANTGDLQVTGGASIAGDLYVGGTFNLTGNELTIGGATFNNGLTLNGSSTPGAETFTINNGNNVINFQVDSATGNTVVNGTINVIGTSQFVGVSAFQNNLSVAGDFAIAGTRFVVLSASGNTSIGGTLGVTGQANFSNNLNVAGTFAINSNKFLVAGSSGNTNIAGSLAVSGTVSIARDFSINTNKFTVSSATGATFIGGTLVVSSGTNLNSSLTVLGFTQLNSGLNVAGSIAVGSNTFSIDAPTGNTSLLGTLNASGATQLGSSLTVQGASYLNSTVSVAGNINVNNGVLVIDAGLGSITQSGNSTLGGYLYVGTTATVAGNTLIGGALTVNGALTLNNLLNIANTLTVATNKFVVDSTNGRVFIAGATTVSNTLHVVNNATLDSSLGVAGNVTITSPASSESVGLGALVVTGGVSVGQKLQVSSDAVVGGNVIVTGNVSGQQGQFSGNVTDNNNRVVTTVNPTGSIGINISNLSSGGPGPSFTINNLGVISVANGIDTTVSAFTGTNVAINVTSTLQSVTNRGATTNNSIAITSTTNSSAVGNGALTVTGGVGVGLNLNVGGATNIGGNLSAANITDNGQRVLVNVVPSGSSGINISNLTKTASTISFTINNLGVNTLAGTPNNITVSQSTGSVTVNLGTTGTAGTYTYISSIQTDQFGRVLTLVSNTSTGASGGQVLANYPTITSPTINGFPVLTNFTGYIYGNGVGQISSSVTIPGAVVTGTVPAAYTATVLTATQNFSISGDVSSPTVGFNGTAGVILNATLATVIQGTGNQFVKISLDTKGRVVGNTAVTAADITSILGTVASTNANNVFTTATVSTATFYPAMIPSSTGTYQSLDYYAGLQFVPSTGIFTTPRIAITGTTVSTTPTTGALTVAGGVGISGQVNIQGGLYVGGDFYVDGQQTVINTTAIQTADKNIYLSTGSINATIATGAGIYVGNPAGSTFISLLFDGTQAWKSSGDLIPPNNGTFSLGYTNNQWGTAYAQAIYDNNNRVLTNVQSGTGTQVLSVGATVLKVNAVPATVSTLGSVKVGTGLSVAADGTISTNASAISTATFTSLGVIKVGNNLVTAADGTVNLPQAIWTTSTVNFDTGVFATQVYVGGQITLNNSGLVAVPGNGLFIEGGTSPGDSINIFTQNQTGLIQLTNYQAGLTINPQTTSITGGNGTTSINANQFNASITTNNGVSVFQFSNLLTFPDNTTQISAALTATTTATATTLGYVKIGLNLNAGGDGTVSLSTATVAKAGAVKIGSGIFVATDGTISVPQGGGGVASISAGTGTHVTASTGSPIIFIGQAVETTSAVTFGSVTSTGNVTDNGNRVITSVTPTAGAGINISDLTATGPSASFTINNLGVNTLAGSSNITASASTGAVTVSFNTLSNLTVGNVTSTGTVAAPTINDNGNRVITSVTPTAGTAINISSVTSTGPSASFTINNLGVTSISTGSTTLRFSASTGSVTLTDLGVQAILPGTGITVNANTGTVTVTNAGVTAFNGSTGNVLGVSSVNGSTGTVSVVGSIIGSTYIGVSGTTAVTLTNLGVQTITGTANQITASSATGTVTLSLPQSIATTSSVTFGSVSVTTATLSTYKVGYTSVTAATYAVTNDSILGVNRAGPVAITLPASAGNTGRVLDIKDESGAAATNNITITPASGTIDGATSLTLNINYGSYRIYCNGTNWFII